MTPSCIHGMVPAYCTFCKAAASRLSARRVAVAKVQQRSGRAARDAYPYVKRERVVSANPYDRASSRMQTAWDRQSSRERNVKTGINLRTLARSSS